VTAPDPPDVPADTLSLDQMIAAPVVSAARAAEALADASADFVRRVGVDEHGAVRTVDFAFSRPVEQPGPADEPAVVAQDVHVSLPLLALVSVPSLRIDAFETHFSLEIRSLTPTGDGAPQVLVKPAAQRENTRDTDKTAKYTVDLRAASAPPSEALARVLDLMAQSVTAIPRPPAKE
jgi:uncharacterized protein DUF2589